MAGVKGKSGGVRPNSGAPKKAIKLSRLEEMAKARGEESIWPSLWSLTQSNDPAIKLSAMKLWLSYEEGMPIQTVNQNNSGSLLVTYDTDPADNTFNEATSRSKGDSAKQSKV
jgi:hypothetical protein